MFGIGLLTINFVQDKYVPRNWITCFWIQDGRCKYLNSFLLTDVMYMAAFLVFMQKENNYKKLKMFTNLPVIIDINAKHFKPKAWGKHLSIED